MSFSSLAWPCTEAFAASHRLLVAVATIRAYSGKHMAVGCNQGNGQPEEKGQEQRNGNETPTEDSAASRQEVRAQTLASVYALVGGGGLGARQQRLLSRLLGADTDTPRSEALG
ncbi:hypothetical protein EYF80_032760 [Liparis tanakae]|uniref:Uncharacterized protein n=1 Tax=Liparis tanakae TaxID=230148 RepID=A0A4Z2GUD3_9TELE|nr:hypothetical protein EYF80_032760 [Liparis tanakae]